MKGEAALADTKAPPAIFPFFYEVLSVLVSHTSASGSLFPVFLAVVVCFTLISASIFLFCPKQFFIPSEFVLSDCSFIAVLFFYRFIKRFFVRLFCFTRYLVHSRRSCSVRMKDFPIPCYYFNSCLFCSWFCFISLHSHFNLLLSL